MKNTNKDLSNLIYNEKEEITSLVLNKYRTILHYGHDLTELRRV